MSSVPSNLVSSQTAHHNQRGGWRLSPALLLFLTLLRCWHAVRLPSPANPAVNSLGRKVWVLPCCVTEWKQLVGGLGQGLSCGTGKRSKERVCGVEGERDAFCGSDKPLAWLSC